MAGKTVIMSIVKQIILLTQQGKSPGKIGVILRISKNTARKYLQLIKSKGLNPEELLTLEDEALAKLFDDKPIGKIDHLQQELDVLLPEYEKALNHPSPGVNRWVLWGEYRVLYPHGYSYSQFCYHLQQYSKQSSAVMHFEHIAGDKIYMDFAGKKLHYVDRSSGEIKEAEVFIATLGYSQYTYVEARASQRKEDFIEVVQNALAYFGGVPKVLVCDNLKSGVDKASNYEADINRSFLELANHYVTTILPTRGKKPRDKALVEKHVSIVYSRIYAPLRSKEFYSIEELNEAIQPLLEKHNNTLFQNKPYSRKECFDTNEKSTLQLLPEERYEIKQYKVLTVLKTSHVYIKEDHHYYSVPYRYIGEKVKIAISHTTVSVYFKNDRIAFYPRDMRQYVYTTINEHLPSTHRFVSEWNDEKFTTWARSIDPLVEEYIKQVIANKPYPEQAYRGCVGILSFVKKAGKDRLVNACKRAIFYNVYNYKIIENIIRSKQDLIPLDDNTGQLNLPFHDNIRGPEYYRNQTNKQ